MLPSSSRSDSPQNSIKLLIVGEAGAGKTTLWHRYIGNTSPSDHKSTIGVSYLVKDSVVIKQRSYKIQCTDTGDFDRFSMIIESFIPKSHAIILCIDPEKLENTAHIIKKIHGTCGALHPPPIVLVFTKSDCMTRDQSDILATISGIANIPTYFCSSKTSENIADLFTTAATLGIQYKSELALAKQPSIVKHDPNLTANTRAPKTCWGSIVSFFCGCCQSDKKEEQERLITKYPSIH